MSTFTWKKRYKIGNATVDEQHKHLFDLANQTIKATETEDLIPLLMQFYQHVRQHFRAEEELMKQHHYPNYAMHVEAHNLMLDKLNAISKTVQSRQWTPADIQAFVNNWLLVHILEVDMMFGKFLKQHGPT